MWREYEKKVMSLLMALMLITCFCMANDQAADNYVTRLGVLVNYQIEQYSPVQGETFSPYPLSVYTTFNLSTYAIVNYFAEDVGKAKYSLVYVSRSGDILNTYITFRYTATTPTGSRASGYVTIGYFA